MRRVHVLNPHACFGQGKAGFFSRVHKKRHSSVSHVMRFLTLILAPLLAASLFVPSPLDNNHPLKSSGVGTQFLSLGKNSLMVTSKIVDLKIHF